MKMAFLPSTPTREYGYDVAPTLEPWGYIPVKHILVQTPKGEKCTVAKYRNTAGVYMYILMDDVAICRCHESLYEEVAPLPILDTELEELRLNQGKFSGLAIEESRLGEIANLTLHHYQDDGNAHSISYVSTSGPKGVLTRHTYPLFTLSELKPNMPVINGNIDDYWTNKNSISATSVLQNLNIVCDNAEHLMKQLKAFYTDTTKEIVNVKNMYSNPYQYTEDIQGKLHNIIDLGNEISSANSALVEVSLLCDKIHKLLRDPSSL